MYRFIFSLKLCSQIADLIIFQIVCVEDLKVAITFKIFSIFILFVFEKRFCNILLRYQKMEIDELNSIQTQVFSTFFKTDDNIFLGAPSGSGKTLCAELAIIKMLEEYPNGRAVYIAPCEALAKVRYEDWRIRFGKEPMDYTVRLLTGDNTTDNRFLNNARIIISNPVHWDKISRRWRRKKAVQNVNLFIVDDLHLVAAEVTSSSNNSNNRVMY